jgi:hypothetical protein
VASMTAPGSCHLVRFQYGNVHADTYDNPLALVFHLLNSGSLADGVHGSAAHEAALERVMRRASEIVQQIKQQRVEESDD